MTAGALHYLLGAYWMPSMECPEGLLGVPGEETGVGTPGLCPSAVEH